MEKSLYLIASALFFITTNCFAIGVVTPPPAPIENANKGSFVADGIVECKDYQTGIYHAGCAVKSDNKLLTPLHLMKIKDYFEENKPYPKSHIVATYYRYRDDTWEIYFKEDK